MTQEVTDESRNTVPSVEPKGSLNDYTWAELKQISRAIAAAGEDEWEGIAGKYRLLDDKGKLQGAEKSFELKGGAKASVRILGFRHDELADGRKAGISFEFAGVPARHRTNPDWTNEGGWEASEIRRWLNDEFLVQLPAELRAIVSVTRKWTNNKGKVSENDVNVVTDTFDKLWLPSVTEMYGKLSGQVEWNSCIINVYNAEGVQYQLYANKEVTLSNYGPCKKDGVSSLWWLRSPRASSSSRFHLVRVDGNWNFWYAADYDGGVSPGFCF